MNPIIKLKNLKYSYKKEKNILDISDFTVNEGEKIFLYGPSGCGKTTLLSILAGIIPAKEGSLKIFGTEFIGAKNSLKDSIRGSQMGYIFQMFNLIPYLNVLDNILLPCKLNFKRREDMDKKSLIIKCKEISKALNIDNILTKKANEISVGQQQRVAAARALLGSPKLIIADEPTSSLDSDARELFLENLFSQCEAQKTTLIFVSHDKSLMKFFPRHIALPDINRAKL
ncbi:ABC transporter ATP-binding protein [Fluviispira multicolorata]|uniref:ATP-binding cassette domain-containing protein n=1 Tax=Fluviispira multicolorata TaxID=2654512 RepID=A0A833JH02_9BACT|nr:ABC transporter ATP-binding protein [Fluviispira multicolorata]KAB8033253.1 ATP-binding cassette domain-containing protein [Fluviispira multicolorata]